jgi:cyclic-di-GMP-binding protein
MAQDSFFDVVSKVDMAELKNAVDQTLREVANRFDFKNSVSDVKIEADKLVLHSDDEYRLNQLIEILQGKMTRRGISVLTLDYGKIEPAAKATVRQEIKLKQGVDADTGRKIVKLIKELGAKVQTQVQGDQVRVTSKSKDDLQKVIQMLRKEEESLGVALQFVNYR